MTPPALCLSVSQRGDQQKDTLANILATGEYVINVVPEELAGAMVVTAGEWDSSVDEFALAGVTALAGETVGAPRVAESPVQMECRLLSATEYGHPPGSYTLIIGSVLRFHIRTDLLRDGRIVGLRSVGRLAGDSYCRIDRVFRLPVPSVPPADGIRQ